jgi:hypothetical protein
VLRRFLCSWVVALRSHRLAGLLALLLVLPSHVTAQTAITDLNLEAAVTAWVTDEATATTTYGAIAGWNTAAVSNMYQVCAASAGARNAADVLGRCSEII